MILYPWQESPNISEARNQRQTPVSALWTALHLQQKIIMFIHIDVQNGPDSSLFTSLCIIQQILSIVEMTKPVWHFAFSIQYLNTVCLCVCRGTLVEWWAYQDLQVLRVSLESLEVDIWWVPYWVYTVTFIWPSLLQDTKAETLSVEQEQKQREIQVHKTDHLQTAVTAADMLKETSSPSCVAAMTLWRCNANK